MTLKQFLLPSTVAILLAAGSVPAYAQQRHGGGGWSGHAPSRSVERARGHVDHRRVAPARPVVRGYRGYRGPFVRTQIVRPFHGPFYAFRPRFRVGVGLFVGFPVTYPWDFVGLYPIDPYDPYGPYAPYAAPDVQAWPNDPYAAAPDNAPPDTANAAPADESRDVGGISLDIKPGDATVTVDGTYAGTVDDFSPSSAPLTVVPGSHHVVVAKPGYRSMIFDAAIAQGQVLPYQGQMQPLAQ